MSAHSRFLSKVIALAAVMSASGCICVTGPSGSSGDITFTWSLNGRTCAQSQEISQVVVRIPGQTLQNNGVYACTTQNTDGIKLLDFRPGTYNYTIEAQNTAGTAIFAASGKVTVNGDVAEHVTLLPTSNATGTAYFAWTFPVGTPVDCRYIAAVDMTIDGTTPITSACSAALYNPNATTLQGIFANLSPGPHEILFDARDQTGLYFYRKVINITINAAETQQHIVTLDWLVGTVALRWTFSNGITQLNCAQAGVSTVGVTFRNANGDITQQVDCQLVTTSGTFDGYTPYIYGGTYQVFLAAYGTGNVIYRSSSTAPPTVTAQAGVFPALTNAAPQILMTLQ
ncbi:MAG: hypothetical protein ACOZQL_06485 [Myxococcota bacterium]